ncbi:hypothetical protein [Scytonema millei]|uniref:Uncharacterized protein n=1 Tax=Scytonema millei VB511283 TaxID=1245923 RepID=A0A9X5I3B9_9CYAN|nr:hypothetical protein [Scytonema millei]NHC34318.1 hypothetical protein [Scytonema millei VB511283]
MAIATVARLHFQRGDFTLSLVGGSQWEQATTMASSQQNDITLSLGGYFN